MLNYAVKHTLFCLGTCYRNEIKKVVGTNFEHEHASTWNPLHFLMLHAFQAVLWFCLLQVLLIRKNVPN